MKIIYSILLVLLFSTTIIMAQVNLKNGLVACYPFNANANDQSGNNNTGIINGASLATDRFGKLSSAYNFNGSSSITVDASQFKNQSFSYATWVKLDILPLEGENNCFIAVGGPGGDQLLSVSKSYQAQSSNGFNVGGYNVGTPIISNNWDNSSPVIGKWYHLVCTRDNNSIKLYVDGQLITNNSTLTSTGGTIPNYASESFVTFGGRHNGTSQFMQGSLDDIYIYNRAITTEEVTALYQSTKLPTIDLKNGLMACYPFNANANDESSNGNNGTVNGATLTTDRFGKANSAYNFNGSNFIALPSDKFAFNEFSYAVWINISTNPTFGDAYRILSIGGNCGDQDINIGNNYFAGGSGISGIGGGGYNISTPTTNSGVVEGTLPTAGQWYHGVITRDKNEIKLYVNGIFIRSVSTNGTLPYYGCDGTVFANIGTRSTQAQSFIGNIDDVHIYNRAINADEVKALYNGNTSQTITITSNNSAPCGGDNIIFTANGGFATSKYQWKVNDVNVGAQTTSNTFSYDTPNKLTDYQAKISVEITDDEICFPNKIALKDAYFNIKNCTPCVNSLLACIPFNVIKTK
jgi:hypothetical protein